MTGSYNNHPPTFFFKNRFSKDKLALVKMLVRFHNPSYHFDLENIHFIML